MIDKGKSFTGISGIAWELSIAIQEQDLDTFDSFVKANWWQFNCFVAVKKANEILEMRWESVEN